MVRLASSIAAVLIGLSTPIAAVAQGNPARTPSAPGATVFFVEPAEGAVVGRSFKVKFGLNGMAVAPAGAPKPGTGHHHVIIDTDLPPFDEPIPADFNHLHFGGGQTEAELTLPPGDHTLQLLLGDHNHVAHNPPIFSKELRIKVVDRPTVAAQPGGVAPAAGGRKPSAPGAEVYFIYPRNGETIFPRSTIRFGLKGMGVAPAGIEKANTGHHHLLVDVEPPPLDQPIPSDFNHIHLGKGQTERKVELTPGEHTLQLVFTDERHVPHDPPLMTEPIKVTVRARRATR